MITGVTKGYEYKMRLVYAHFPININIHGGWRMRPLRKRARQLTTVPCHLPGTYQASDLQAQPPPPGRHA